MDLHNSINEIVIEATINKMMSNLRERYDLLVTIPYTADNKSKLLILQEYLLKCKEEKKLLNSLDGDMILPNNYVSTSIIVMNLAEEMMLEIKEEPNES